MSSEEVNSLTDKSLLSATTELIKKYSHKTFLQYLLFSDGVKDRCGVTETEMFLLTGCLHPTVSDERRDYLQVLAAFNHDS